MTKKKINHLLHKWLSIPLGVIIFILCSTGAALVFQQEILELSNPSHYFVEKTERKPIPLDQLIPMINDKLIDNSIANVKISNDPQRTYTMTLTEGFRVSIFVDQYTGEILGRYAVKEHGLFKIMSLHRWLLDDSHTWGKYTMGWSTVLFIVIIITGLCYINKKKKSNYKVHLNKGTRVMMLCFHNTLGTYAALVLIICSLSGLMWSFEWFRNSVFAIAGAKEESQQTRGSRSEKKQKKVINTIHWQTALENTIALDPTYDYVRIADGLATIHPSTSYRARVQDKYAFDKSSGAITKVTPFTEADVKTKVWAWAYSLHVGDYWGIWSKIFTFIFCLIGASLPITGYYFTIKKWSNKRKKLAKSKS